MKDQKRAYRRYQNQVLLERRAKRNYHWIASPKEKSWADFWKEVKSGKTNTWMRSMNVACSCFICSGHRKYSRPDSGALKKEIENLLSEENNGIQQD